MEGLALGVSLFFACILLPLNVASIENGIDIYSLHVDSKVTSRYAHSTITSKVVNRANVSQEAAFEVELPKTAFITNFSMTIDGVKYPGMIQEKKEAQERYDKAVSRGQSAGLVKATGRMLEKFQVSVNVASAGKVTFELIYEELLKRKLGKYQLLIKVKPKQLVKHFQIDVHILEPQGILFVTSNSTFMTNELSEALTMTTGETEAVVSFKPTLDQQRKGPGLEESILDGDLMITYDVRRSTSAGDVQIINGYFVHYFAPPEMPTLSKNVIFVVDTSGSMYGRKIAQTREALLKILEDISSEDHFNIVTFSSDVSRWKNSMVKATEENIEEAKSFVKSIRDRGATDINEALLIATRILDEAMENRYLPERSISMIILLTDGAPTVGITNIKEIQMNVRNAIKERYTLYCLGFGFDVDYKFLEKMALENGGLARRIYEDSDSALQLQGFYQEVANPILMKIQLEYPDNSILHLTENNFRQLFDGSEIVVAGKIDGNDIDVYAVEIKAQAHVSDLVFKVEENIAEKEEALKKHHYVFGDFIERLWAYLTIQQLLEKVILADGAVQKDLEQKALQLSLKYSFVTPLTSMLVTKPEDQEKPMVANKPTEDGQKEDMQLSRSTYSHGRKPFRKMSQRPISAGSLNYALDPFGPHRLLRYDQGSTLIRGFSPSIPRPVPEAQQLATVIPPTISNSDTEDLLLRADEYPDVIIQLPNKQNSYCLDIIGELNNSTNLIADPDKGIWLNGGTGQLGKQRRNCVSFEITYKDPEMVISVSRDEITLQSLKGKQTMDWRNFQEVTLDSLNISVEKKTLTIRANGKIMINIFNLRSSKRCLGLHLTDDNTFSSNVTGLIGQFYSNATFGLNSGDDQNAQETSLTVQGQIIKATRHMKRNFKTSPGSADKILCWLVKLNQN